MILKDIDKAFITVHMGIGQFRRVDVEDLSKHRMDSERLIISEEACRIINKAKNAADIARAVATMLDGKGITVCLTNQARPSI
jgi:S-adenosylmethionine:tRNA ribosyltransferase-isomerase